MTQTAIEWLQEQLECFGNKHELQMSWATVDELLEQAKEMEKQQIEISDEEIEKAVKNPMHDAYDFREGAMWYREQLKSNI